MAQIALTVGIAAGSMAINYLFRPRTKQQPVDKGKMDDVRVTFSDLGAFIPRGWGTVRIGGNVIWSDGIQHKVIESGGGGGGGGKGSPPTPTTRTHIYTTSVAVLIARSPVSQFLRTWADADLVINNYGGNVTGILEAENATLTGAATHEDGGASGGSYVSLGTAAFSLAGIPIDPPNPGDELLPRTLVSFYYKSATDVTAGIVTNGSESPSVFFPASPVWTVISYEFGDFFTTLSISGAIDLDYIVAAKYYFTESRPVTGAINHDIAYPPDVDDPSAYYNAPLKADSFGKIALANGAESIRFYKGTGNQTQDSAIVAWLDARFGAGQGAAHCPAFRDTDYVVFDTHQLKQANLENFTFEVKFAAAATVNKVLTDLFTEAGIGGHNFSATTGLSQVGFLEHTKQPRRSLVEFLERYHGFRIAEIDGMVKTVVDSTVSIADIDSNLLRARAESEEMPRTDAVIVNKEEDEFPREVHVSVMNPDLEYHNDDASAAVFASVSAEESKSYTFPIVDRLPEARRASEKLLLKEHTEDKKIEHFGMPEMAKYSVGDVITIYPGGRQVKMRVEKKQITLPIGKIKFSGVAVSPFTPAYIQDDTTNIAVKAQRQFSTYSFPRNSVVVPIISKPVQTKHSGRLGVYLGVSGRGFGAAEKISVFREFAEDYFELQYVADTPSVMGLAGILADWGDLDTEDDGTLDIYLFNEFEFESVTADDIERYPQLNLMRVGDEWIQFRTAEKLTLEDDSPHRAKWRLSNFMRGRFGTQSAVGLHASEEYCVFYNQSLKFFELEKTDIGETVTLKAVTNGQLEENGQITSFEFNPLSAYEISNATANRTLDADSTTLNELADVVSTLIEDTNL